ncbi:putative [Ribulose-bisphosphate carboxylase]-lysine N-methyltransferase [Helianthus annuus]|nr:putative [Ribulose-bisphosphate carboxylase]-lysine N-methyltransferase [Helianthus annuus]
MGSSNRQMRAFKRWMNHHSIHYSDAIDILIHQHQVYVQALYNIHEGDLIATIPKQSCLTVKSSGACDLIEGFGLEGYMALSVALMYEKSLGQLSPWFGYLQLLPDSNPDVPLLWSVDEIDDLLLGTELHKTVKEDKALVYEDWKACIVPFVESAQLDPSDFTLDQYFAAKSLISSRSFQIDDYYGFGMVPLADLFNHKTDAEDVHFTSVSSHSDSDTDSSENIENRIDDHPDGDSLCQIQNESTVTSPEGDLSAADDTFSSNTEILEMIMVRDVKAGSEVFNTYGSMGNAALLHRYGFTEPDNPYNIVNIDLELVLQWSSSLFSSRHTRSRLSLWKRLHVSEVPNQQIDYFEISSDGEPEVELLKLISIILLPEKAYNEFDRSKVALTSNKKGIVWNEITERNKRLLLTESVRGGLLSLADIRERCYGLRSVEDDVEALEACPVTERKLYHSLVLRISERRILEKLRVYASVGSARVRSLGVCNGSTMRKKLQKR